MRRLRWLVPLAMLLVLLAFAAAPFTVTGTRLAVALANSVPGLSVVHRAGALFGDLELTAVRYEAGSIEIGLEDVSATLERACLWESRLCFSRLSTRSLIVVVKESGDQSSSESDAGDYFSLPFGIRAPQLQLGSTQVRWPGGGWDSGAISAGVSFRGEELTVRRLVIPEARLDLGASEGPPATDRVVLPRIFLPLAIQVVDGRIGAAEVIADGTSYQLQQFALSAQWRGERLGLGQLATQLPGWGILDLSGQLDFAGEWPVLLRMEAQLAESETLPEFLRDRTVTVSGDGSLGAMGWSLTVPGESSLNAVGQLDLLQPGVPFSGDIELAWQGQEALSKLLTLPPALTELQPRSPVTLTASGDLNAQQFELRAAASGINYPDLQASVRGTHSDGLVALEQISLTETATDSAFTARGELGYREQLRWAMVVESTGVTLPAVSSYVSGRLQGSAHVEGELEGNSWQSHVRDIAITGTVNELPATVLGDLSLSSEQLVVRGDFEADINGAEVSLTKSAGEGGRLDLVVADLGRWLPGGEGDLRLESTLGADRGEATFSGTMNRLRWQDVSLAELTLSGRARLLDELPFELSAAATGMSLGRLAGEQAQLSLTGNTAAVSGTLDVRGDVEALVQLDASATGELWQGSLAAERLVTPAGEWRPSQPVEFAVDTEHPALEISAHCWRATDSEICLDPSTIGEQSSIGAQLDLELSLLEFLLPPQLSLSGRVVGRADAEWGAADALVMSAGTEISSVRFVQQLPEGETAEFNLDTARLALDAGEAGTRLQASMDRDAKRIAVLDLALAPGEDRALSGTMVFDDFRLAALRPFAPQLSRLTGKLDGNIEISGSLDKPLLRGRADVSEGYVTVVGNPNALEALTLAVNLDGTRASLNGAGQLGGGATTLSGTAGWGGERELTLRLEGQRNRLLVPPYSELLVSSAFDVSVTRELATVEGQVTVHEGRLEHEQLPAGSVAVSDDVIEVDYAGNVLRDNPAVAIRSRVRVLIEDRFRVVGSNIDATVGGDLRLEQDPERPMQVFGTLNVIGGEVRAYGQRLSVAQGSIDFSGDPDNPQLNLRAERDIPRERVLVGVTVTGTLEAPRLEIYSDPAMPQTAALSWLVRGRGPDTGTGADGTAMAIAMGASAINQTGVVSEINRIPGISNVEFGSEGTEDDTAATVSGYIGERIFVSYGVGIYEPINVLTARLYLQARLWLEVVSRLENSVDLYYSFDID